MSTIRDTLANKNNPKIASLIDGYDRRNEQRRGKNQKNNERHHGRIVDETAATSHDRRSNMGHNNRRPVLLEDGVDHINLWDRGATELGRLLTMEAPIHVSGPYGEFTNIFQMFVFLTTINHPEIIRTWSDGQLREWVKKRKEMGKEITFPNIRYICLLAMFDYVKRDDALCQAMLHNSNVDFACYTENRNGRFHRRQWWLEGICIIRDIIAGKIDQTEGDKHLSRFLDQEEIFPELIYTESAPLLGTLPKPKKEPVKKQMLSPDEFKERARLATKEASQALTDQLRKDLETSRPSRVIYFSDFEARRLAMAKLILSDQIDSDSYCTDKTDEFNLALFIWDHDDKIQMVSTDVFENPLDDGHLNTTTRLECDDDLVTIIREQLSISDSVPDEAIQIRVITPVNSRKEKNKPDEIVIREDVFESGATQAPMIEEHPLVTLG